jgi:hypothetical protein
VSIERVLDGPALIAFGVSADLVDSRDASPLAGGVRERVPVADRSPDLEERDQDEDDDREDEGELEERLPTFPTLPHFPAASPGAHGVTVIVEEQATEVLAARLWCPTL